MQKKNYNLEMEKMIRGIDLNHKPRLLLHSCCGPCSSAVLERICRFFDMDVFYYNPNIDTAEEFYRRAEEQKDLVDFLGLKRDVHVAVVKYDHDEFLDAVKGFEAYQEGGARCFKCYKQRLEKTAEYAKKEGYDYFTTTLSISPHKDSQILNRLGEYVAKKYGVHYLYSDFKKKNGFRRSCELTEQFQMYRQDYCGCEFSKIEVDSYREKSEREE